LSVCTYVMYVRLYVYLYICLYVCMSVYSTEKGVYPDLHPERKLPGMMPFFDCHYDASLKPNKILRPTAFAYPRREKELYDNINIRFCYPFLEIDR
jgi:hypothetical protein